MSLIHMLSRIVKRGEGSLFLFFFLVHVVWYLNEIPNLITLISFFFNGKKKNNTNWKLSNISLSSEVMAVWSHRISDSSVTIRDFVFQFLALWNHPQTELSPPISHIKFYSPQKLLTWLVLLSRCLLYRHEELEQRRRPTNMQLPLFHASPLSCTKLKYPWAQMDNASTPNSLAYISFLDFTGNSLDNNLWLQ